jgi:nitric oxide reductase NorE protein
MTSTKDNAACGPQTDRRERRLPAEAGLWLFIFGDLVVFTLLFLVYLAYRIDEPELFASSQQTLSINVGAVNTLVLLCSSLFVVGAVRATRAGNRQLAPCLVLAAMACGFVFVSVKVFEYHAKLATDHTPASNYFYFFYFFMTGLHLVHVVIGLGVLTFLWRLTRRADELSSLGMSSVEGSASFWHLVDLLWIVIFPLLYLVQ